MNKRMWKQAWGSVRFFVKGYDATPFDPRHIVAFNVLVKRSEPDPINNRFRLFKEINHDVPF